MEPIDLKESLLRTMYFDLFDIVERIKKLKSVDVYMEKDCQYELDKHEIRLLEEQQIFINRYIKQVVIL